MARIHMLVEQSDQSKARKVMAGWFKDDEQYDKRMSGGKTTLELFEVCELIVRITFNRANPKYGSVGNREVKSGVMPKVLKVTLKNDILPKAKRDTMREGGQAGPRCAGPLQNGRVPARDTPQGERAHEDVRSEGVRDA